MLCALVHSTQSKGTYGALTGASRADTGARGQSRAAALKGRILRSSSQRHHQALTGSTHPGEISLSEAQKHGGKVLEGKIYPMWMDRYWLHPPHEMVSPPVGGRRTSTGPVASRGRATATRATLAPAPQIETGGKVVLHSRVELRAATPGAQSGSAQLRTGDRTCDVESIAASSGTSSHLAPLATEDASPAETSVVNSLSSTSADAQAGAQAPQQAQVPPYRAMAGPTADDAPNSPQMMSPLGGRQIVDDISDRFKAIFAPSTSPGTSLTPSPGAQPEDMELSVAHGELHMDSLMEMDAETIAPAAATSGSAGTNDSTCTSTAVGRGGVTGPASV